MIQRNSLKHSLFNSWKDLVRSSSGDSRSSQANEGLTPYLAGQKYAIRFYD